MSDYVTAIDFGSSKIALAIGEKRSDGLYVSWYDSVESSGIRNGEIQNEAQAEKALRALIEKAEESTGKTISDVITGISGREILFRDVTAEDVNKDANRIIHTSDIVKMTNARYSEQVEGRVYEVAPQSYDIDDFIGGHEEDLDGMRGSAMTGHYRIFYGKNALLNTRLRVISDCRLTLRRSILCPIASARAVLTRQEMENGVAVVDIGKGCTEVVIIKDNTVRDLYSIPFAGESVTNDIRTVTNLGLKRAEELKVRYGYCLAEKTPDGKILELTDENGEVETSIQLQELTGIVESRISEIFDAVRYILDNSKYSSKLPCGVVITGGSAYLSYILPLAKAILERKCRLDAPRVCITPDSAQGASDAGSATAVGLLVEWFDRKLSTTGLDAKAVTAESVIFPSSFFDDGNVTGQETESVAQPEAQSEAQPETKSDKKSDKKSGKKKKTDVDIESEFKPEPGADTTQPEEPKKPGLFKKFISEIFGDNGNQDKA